MYCQLLIVIYLCCKIKFMEENISIWKNSLTHGVILGLVLIVFAIMMYVFNTFFNPNMQTIYYLIIVTTIVIGTLKQKKLENGIISYGKALAVGTIVSFVGAVIFSMFVLVLFKYIDSSLIDRYLYDTEKMYIELGKSDKEIELLMMYPKLYPVLVNVFGYIFGFSFIGFLLSLVTSIFLKNKNKNIA